MNKKLTTAVILSTALFATTAQATGWKTNFLIGAEGGWASRSHDLTVDQQYPVATGLADTHYIRNHSDSGGIWGGLVGVQTKCKEFLFGLEVDVSWQDFGDRRDFHVVDAQADHMLASAKFERGTVVALTARAGYEMAPYFMPYIKAGAETSDDKLIISATPVAGTAFAAGVTGTTFENKQQKVRFVGGIGFEVPIVADAVARVEYNYSTKSRVTTWGYMGLPTAAKEYYTARYRPDQHAIKVAAVWNFYYI